MVPAHDAGTRSRTLLPSLAVATGHVLWRAAARSEVVAAEVVPDDVDLNAWAALVALGDGDPLSQQRLAERIAVSRTTMTKVAGALAGADLVERARNPDDRRSWSLTRTTAGAAAAADWAPYAEEVDRVVTSPLTTREAGELLDLLRTVTVPLLDPGTPDVLLHSEGFLVSRLHTRMHAEVMAALRDLDVEPRHLGSLIALDSVGAMSQADLARHLGVSAPTAVEIVDHLEARGLVARRRPEHDRRTQVLHLLPESVEVARVARDRADRTLVAVTSLPAAARARMTELLARLVTGG